VSPAAALTGSLRELELAEILEWVAVAGRDGVVEFRGAAPALLALHRGDIVVALADDGPSIHQTMVGSGVATEEMWDEAHRSSLRGSTLADALVEAGADPDRLDAALFDQSAGTVMELLLPSDTTFAFLPGATHPVGHRYRHPAGEVIAEARRRVEAWKDISGTIPSTALVMRLAPEPPGERSVTVDADDWRVLARVDGHRSVADVISELGMSAFTVCAVLHRLAGQGLVAPV
jgi:hypothetical protein